MQTQAAETVSSERVECSAVQARAVAVQSEDLPCAAGYEEPGDPAIAAPLRQAGEPAVVE